MMQIIILFTFLFSLKSWGMTISGERLGSSEYLLTMSGSVEFGDADKLQSLIPEMHGRAVSVLLNSPGGYVDAGKQIISVIREIELQKHDEKNP